MIYGNPPNKQKIPSHLKSHVRKKTTPIVTSHMIGQLGNNLFQVAAASALAWDNDAEPVFVMNAYLSKVQPVFHRCTILPSEPKVSFTWNEPIYSYRTIPFRPNMRIHGYFQSERYFEHHRKELLNLFAPHPDDLAYIQKKYQQILDHPNTVGVQIRYYRWEDPTSRMYPQFGKKYLEKAMALFPDSSLFVISSNNLKYAKESIPPTAKNVIFLENERNYIDLYVLSMCKHNIITNSSFGWWAAWLNQNPHQKVVYSNPWVYGLPAQDVCPSRWIKIDGCVDLDPSKK
jgi:hypothetical protein